MFKYAHILLAILLTLFTAIPALAEVINVPVGGDLQAALNRAIAGDSIVLPAGSRFVGEFRLPAKSGVVTLTSGGQLPVRRITPQDIAVMATISSGVPSAALQIVDSSNWVIDGIRFEGNVGGYGEVINVSNSQNITFRRVLLDLPHPDQMKRFISGNGRNITLTQSYCAGVWRLGQDSQCFGAWNGAGPFTITDNFLEAASENVMFGGSASSSEANIPSDILIEGNHFYKRPSWQNDGVSQVIKNLFELKEARRVTVRNNLFENNWGGEGQSGRAIVFTPRTDNTPWTVISDVLFEHNTIRNVSLGFNLMGYDDYGPSQQTTRIIIRDNDIHTLYGMHFMVHREVGDLQIYRNNLTGGTLSEWPVALSFDKNGMTWAALNMVWAENQYTGLNIHSPEAIGQAAFPVNVRNYSLTIPVVEPTPVPTPEPEPIDPVITTLQTQVATLQTQLTALQTQVQELLTGQISLVARLQALITYLRMTPQ